MHSLRAEIAAGAGLEATLRPYQEQGLSWLKFIHGLRSGGVLADDMGLGKTVQALCAVRGRTLVVCPTSVLPTWAAEIERFRPGLRTCIYHGAGRALDESADVTITSYAILRLDAETLRARRYELADSEGRRRAMWRDREGNTSLILQDDSGRFRARPDRRTAW